MLVLVFSVLLWVFEIVYVKKKEIYLNVSYLFNIKSMIKLCGNV